ncbi:MAG: hypothetical protein PQJ58_02780 [Spirochaetales bacterium]|nr:hypothetical protein [Spirochaetales bacterium]
MNKKVIILVSLIFLLSAGAVFAETGIGAAFGYGRFGSNVALSLDVDAIPGSVQTVSLQIHDGYMGIGVTDDWYLIDDVFIDNPFGWYFGLGFYVDMAFANDFALALGARAPIGLDVTVLDDQLLFYIEAAPILGLSVTPSFDFPHWNILGSFGFRFYF